MELEFVKLNGCGNDFVFVDGMNGSIDLDPEQVAYICDRHFGIGGDGVIVVEPPRNSDSVAFMNYINSDGTFAQMCGNGVRCFAKYLIDRDIADKSSGKFDVDTRAGVRTIRFKLDDLGLMEKAKVDMGEPILDPESVPVNLESNACTPSGNPYVKEAELDSPWGPFAFTCVSMGNPHAVCFIDEFDDVSDALFPDPNDKSLDTLDIDAVGSYFESHPVFPEKVNVEFAVIEPDGISMRVYERGCGETLACGTGACATDVAAFLTGRTGRHNIVHLAGGDLDIDWLESGEVMMEGPATESFSGTIAL